MKRRHWYHVSGKFRGYTWDVKPIDPPYRGLHEPPTPRLCVGPSPCACFAARLFVGHAYIYRTARPCRAVKPPDSVSDRFITGERWIIHPWQMEFVRKVHRDDYCALTMWQQWYLQNVDTLNHHQKLWIYREMVEIFEPMKLTHRRERLFVELMCERLKVSDEHTVVVKDLEKYRALWRPKALSL